MGTDRIVIGYRLVPEVIYTGTDIDKARKKAEAVGKEGYGVMEFTRSGDGVMIDNHSYLSPGSSSIVIRLGRESFDALSDLERKVVDKMFSE